MIGARLRESRLEEKMTQEELGAFGGVSVRVQQSYEAGKTFPTAEYLAKVYFAGIDTHYVLHGHRFPVVTEINEPAQLPLSFALVKNIFELFRDEPRCQSLDAETLARVFVVLYRNNLNWNTKIGGDTLTAVLDALLPIE